MMSPVLLLLVSVAAAIAASAPTYGDVPDYYPMDLGDKDIQDNVIVPQKRAALVLDRLLIALQKALHDEENGRRIEVEPDGPRAAPLRFANIETNDMTGLQRRGQGPRGRVLRCYFNAITCF